MKNTNVTLVALFTASSVWGIGCAGEDIGAVSTEGHAEKVYGSYVAAAAGSIDIAVDVRDAGRLVDIADVPLDERLGVPAEWLRMEVRGTEITGIHREARDPGQDEWQNPINLREFDALGWPVDEADYRLLEVTTRYQGIEAAHQALEVCWAAEGRCLVMDPVIWQVESYYRNRQRLLAERWAPQVEYAKATGSCTLNSHPTWSGEYITYGAYWIEYYNVFGVVLVRKDMGGQQVGISCYVSGESCKSSGFGYSNTSSCFANIGYTCDCENTGNQVGTSPDGSSTKSWSESKCAHRALLTASVAWTIEGVGSSFNINWDTAGSVDSIGGQLYDACSWH